MNGRIVILGHGMAGGRLAEKLVEYGWAGEIAIVGDEERGYYNRVKLLELFDGQKTEGDLFFADEQFYQSNNIELYDSVSVRKVDLQTKTLMLSNAKLLHYDYLVFATGASPIIPDLSGMNLADWHVLRNLRDARKLMELVGDGRRIAIVGGGLVALELAEALKARNCEVDLLLRGDRIFRRLFPAKAADIYRKKLIDSGIRIHENSKPVAFEKDGEHDVLNLASGQNLQADSFVFALGTKPNMELAANAGLKTATGISVDEKLCSSDECVFALGEVAEVNGRVWDVVSDIWRQADVLAKNLTGGIQEFAPETTPLVRPKASVSMLSIGADEAGAHEKSAKPSVQAGTRLRIEQRTADSYISLDSQNGRIASAFIVGNDRLCAGIEGLYGSGEPIGSIDDISDLLSGGNSWPDSFVVCDCFNITSGEVKDAIEIQGLKTLDELTHSLKVGKACGSCYSRLETILSDSVENYEPGSESGNASFMQRLRTRQYKGFTLFMVLSYIVDIVILLSGVIAMVTGIIKFPGLIGVRLLRRLPMGLFQFLHDWGGLLFTVFGFIHIIMHWSMIMNFIRQMFSRKNGTSEAE